MSPSDERPGETIVQPVRSGPAKVPAMADYYQVLPAYREDAEEAITREKIPRKYETEVRRYYESLDKGPPKRAGSGSADATASE